MAIVKPPRRGCPLRETPLEIMEMIFGNVHFSDLEDLLLAAKWIRVNPFREPATLTRRLRLSRQDMGCNFN
jgi:hypothetical protein